MVNQQTYLSREVLKPWSTGRHQLCFILLYWDDFSHFCWTVLRIAHDVTEPHFENRDNLAWLSGIQKSIDIAIVRYKKIKVSPIADIRNVLECYNIAMITTVINIPILYWQFYQAWTYCSPHIVEAVPTASSTSNDAKQNKIFSLLLVHYVESFLLCSRQFLTCTRCGHLGH